MNTFWWRRWKCVYTNIILTTSLILNGYTKRDDSTSANGHSATNCVHWAKSEIDRAAPEEWIIDVCQRSIFLGIMKNITKKKELVKNIDFDQRRVSSINTRWISSIRSNFQLKSVKENTWINVSRSCLISENMERSELVKRLHIVSALLQTNLHRWRKLSLRNALIYWSIKHSRTNRSFLIDTDSYVDLQHSRNLLTPSKLDWKHILSFSHWRRTRKVFWSINQLIANFCVVFDHQ